MKTELQRIKSALFDYRNADERSKAFAKAKDYLEKVHGKYGTIDVGTITELIR